MKGSPEEGGQKGLGADGRVSRVVAGQEDLRPETSRVKIQEDDLTHKKVEKTESNSGENSNLSSKNFSTPDKWAGAISHVPETDVSKKLSQADTLNQIVKKSVLHLENGRSEFKIDLKPETLGHLKMQILTENHHVTIRILTENHAVKEMIENNLAQLKANFQNQGLEMEKFDVSVALNWDKNGTGGGGYGSKRAKEKFVNMVGAGYGERAEETEETGNMRKRGLPDGAVNLFA